MAGVTPAMPPEADWERISELLEEVENELRLFVGSIWEGMADHSEHIEPAHIGQALMWARSLDVDLFDISAVAAQLRLAPFKLEEASGRTVLEDRDEEWRLIWTRAAFNLAKAEHRARVSIEVD